MRRLIQITPLLALMALAACETVQGAGRDIQDAGKSLTNESAAVQQKM